MVDFNINLAKSMTSSPVERARFYNRMLIYLVICAAMLVGVAFWGSRSILAATKANHDRKLLVETLAVTSEYGESFFKNPDQAYDEFKGYATDLETLRSALEKRSQFLPVMSQLLSGFSKEIGLQSLSASDEDKAIEFVLVAPVIDEAGNDVLRELQDKWRSNEELRLRAHAVSQLTSEREMVGDTLMAYVRYRCIVK